MIKEKKVDVLQVIFNVLAPRLLSQQVGLHPLLVFLAVLTGARVAGIWGAIFGVPIVAGVIALLLFAYLLCAMLYPEKF